MTEAPYLGELLRDAPSNWGKWGESDEVGSLNYLDAGTRCFVASEPSSRVPVFTLQRLIGDPKGDPVWPGRSPAERTQIFDESSWDGDDAPNFPGGPALRGRQDRRVPAGLDAVRRTRPCLVRRRPVERILG